MAERSFMDRLRAFFGFPVRAESEDARGADALPPPAAPPPSADQSYGGRLPESSQGMVREINALLTELERRAHGKSLFEETIELQRLKTTHLPSLLQSYVEIPPEHRAEVFRETGRSASYLLNERLGKILERLHDLSRQLARGNLNAFTENIRFIDMRYDAMSSPFD